MGRATIPAQHECIESYTVDHLQPTAPLDFLAALFVGRRSTPIAPPTSLLSVDVLTSVNRRISDRSRRRRVVSLNSVDVDQWNPVIAAAQLVNPSMMVIPDTSEKMRRVRKLGFAVASVVEHITVRTGVTMSPHGRALISPSSPSRTRDNGSR